VRLFVDTSALFALLDEPSAGNRAARDGFLDWRRERTELLTHNYVIAEAAALVQRRLGANAAVDLLTRIVPAMQTLWVNEAIHDAAVSAFLASVSRSVSLVDRVSFEVMRRERIDTAFAFDAAFARAGFRTVP